MDTQPFFLGVTPSGPASSKREHARMPLASEEIALTAAACADAGAALMRLHLRDRNGLPTLDPESVRNALGVVRAAAGRGMVAQVAARAGELFSTQDIANVTRDVRPDSVAFWFGEILADEKTLSEVARFLAWVARERIIPHYVLADAAEIGRYLSLRERGAIPDAPHLVEFAPPASAEEPVVPDGLLSMIDAHRKGDMSWTCRLAGAAENRAVMLAAALGGHGMVGFEGNLLLPDGSLAPDNAALVRVGAALAPAAGRPLGDGAELRARLGR